MSCMCMYIVRVAVPLGQGPRDLVRTPALVGCHLRWSRTSRVGDGRAAVAARPRSPAVRAPHDVDAGDGVASSTASAAVTSAASFPFLRVLSGSTSRWLAAAAFSGVATRARSRARAHQGRPAVIERAQAKHTCRQSTRTDGSSVRRVGRPSVLHIPYHFASVPGWAHTVHTVVLTLDPPPPYPYR